jgi:hypothetical protein
MAGDNLPAAKGERDIDVRRYGDLAIVIGLSMWHDGAGDREDYFSRIWVKQSDGWRLVATHNTDASPGHVHGVVDISRREVPTQPIASGPPPSNALDDVRRAIDEQHVAYWSKDPEKYRRYAGADLLRIAETGMRPREELIRMMRGNARLPAPPSEQRDVQVRLYGNAAVTTWIDVGRGAGGAETRNRFTVVFVRRPQGWQMVHIQSTGVKTPSYVRETVAPRR